LRKTPEKPKSFFNLQISWTPPLLWTCFFLLLAGHLLLSFADLSPANSIWTGIFLIGFPFFSLLKAALEDTREESLPLYRQEVFQAPGWLAWFSLALIAVAARLYRLTSLSAWPSVDEGVHAFIALDLCRHWNWRILSYCSQLPPFYFWLEGVLFKMRGPSLSSLWLLPSVLSLLPFLFAYRESKRYFSKSFSFLLAFAAGLGFWPLLAGRYSHPAVLVFPWACLTLAGLGRFVRAERDKEKLYALLLGLLAGTGFYTYLSWAPVALWTALVVLWKSRGLRAPFWIFTAALLASLLPLAGAMVQNGYGNYLAANWALSNPGGILLLLLSPFRYLRALFWGDPHYYFYSSTWGGLLNPLAASFFSIGLAGLFRPGSRKMGFWFLAALALFLLPGILTSSINGLRVIQALPVVLFCSAVGFQTLAAALPPLPRGKVVLAVLLASASMDVYHLGGPYHRLWTSHQESWPINSKSVEYPRAYPLLEEQNRREGPGLIFTAFQPNWTDQSLTVATYGFNAALNPALDPSTARWAAWVCNIHYLPFLEARFPEGRAVWLSEGVPGDEGGWMLEIVPVSGQSPETWARWTAANNALLDGVSVLMNRKEGGSYAETRQALLKAQPLAQGDPFLECCLWEQVFNSYNSDAAYGDRHQFKDFQGALAALDQGLILGYPNAYFYNERGSMEVLVGQRKEAMEDFKRAVRCSLDKTSAADNLKALEGQN
jgi:tetratricopeptide (TPR) repeat protein